MKFLFVLDSVEAPRAANPQLGRRLALQLAAQGHTVHLLELWDGLTPPPTPTPPVVLHTLAFADERLMNTALENGRKDGSPVLLRLARLAAHPTATAAAFRQLVLHRPRRTTAAKKEIEALCAAHDFDVVTAVCAPYRTAFALEEAQISAKKVLWQLDPYASNKEYAAPGGAAREAKLAEAMHAIFVTPQALPDYQSGPLAAVKDKVQVLPFPCLIPPEAPVAPHSGIRCVFCGSLYPEIRTPDFLLDLFTAMELPGVTLTMAGGGWQYFEGQKQAAKATMGARLQLPGVVAPAQARQLLCNADVLVNIGNTTDNQVPSKLYEYFGLCKPIVHLQASEADPTMTELQKYPLSFTLSAAEGATDLAVAALSVWLKENAGRTLPFSQVSALYPQYTPAAVAATFLARM